MAGLTAASLSAISGELRSLHTTLGGWAADLESMRTTARGNLDDADGNWGGPRSLRTLAAVRDYLGRLDPVLEAISPTQAAVSSLAAAADEIAGALDHADGLDASARALRATGLPEIVVDAVGLERAADRVRAAAELAWVAACASLTAAVEPSLAVIRGFAADVVFAGGEATTSAEYVFVIAQYSALTGVPIAELDPTGQVAVATDEWIELLSSTEIGAMYFMVLESMKDADIGEADWNLSGEDLALAAQDPERLRALFVQWGAANGVEFDAATLDFLTAQATTGAVLLAAAGNEGYRDIDDRIKELKPGDGAQTALGYVTGLASSIGLALVQVQGDPAVTNQWWRGLSNSQQTTLVINGPASLGNTDGIPAAVRDDVNRAQLAEDIAELEHKRETEGLTTEEEQQLENAYQVDEMLLEQEAHRDPLTNEPAISQLYVYEPDAFGGDGRVAVSIGDIDTAEHVAVAVPGLSSDVTGMDPAKTQAIYDEARWASGESVAVIDWMGYDAPSYSTSESSGTGDQVAEGLDIANVTTQEAARQGAEQLAADVAGINAMRPEDDPHLTVIGNSYGSTTSAMAAAEFDLQADDLVLTGSPGAGSAETADDLSTGADHTYVISGSTDLVTYLGESGGWDLTDQLADSIPGVEQMGQDPSTDEFGAVRLAGEYADRNQDAEVVVQGVPIELPGDVEGHKHYYDRGSESLFNVAAVVGGEPDVAMEADPRHKDPAFETHTPIEDVDWDGDLWDWTPGLDFEASNESIVEANLFPVDPEGDREIDPDAVWTHNPNG